MLKLIKYLYDHFKNESTTISKLIDNITPRVIGSKDEAFLRFFWRDYQVKYLEACHIVLNENDRCIEEITRLAGTPPFEDSFRNFFLYDENFKKILNIGFTSLPFLLNEQKTTPKSDQRMCFALMLLCEIVKKPELIDTSDRNKWTLEKALNIILPQRFSTSASYKKDNLDDLVALVQKPILFEHRLKLLNIPDEEIPEKFFDPISLQVMEDPIIATDFRSYNRTTYEGMSTPKVGPFDRQKNFEIVCDNQKLKNEIREYIIKKEMEYKESPPTLMQPLLLSSGNNQALLTKKFGLNAGPVVLDKKPLMTKDETKEFLKSVLNKYTHYNIDNGVKIDLVDCSIIECMIIKDVFDRYFNSLKIKVLTASDVPESGVLILNGIFVKDLQEQLVVEEYSITKCCFVM